MKLTAKQFNNNPAAAFRAADKGEEVIITHDRHDKDFVLMSKDALYDDMKWSQLAKAGEMMQSHGPSEEDMKRTIEYFAEEV